MKSENYTIRTMTRNDIDTAVEWAAKEGWNPGLEDADSFYAADNGGFLVGEIGKEPVSTISAVKYDKDFGFIGFYIVKHEFRGKGYGNKIWREAVKRLNSRNIGLDGVVEQQANYKKFGFKKAYNNMRYEGETGGTVSDNPLVMDLSKIPFEMIINYDEKFFLKNRALFLKSWINQKQSLGLGIIEKRELSGMGVIRKCRNGYKIGPLFAKNSDYAELLFCDLKAMVSSGEKFYLDIPDLNKDSLLIAEKYKMELCFETARMYTGDFPKLPVDKIFGVTSFELG